jgi:hypothetical protein
LSNADRLFHRQRRRTVFHPAHPSRNHAPDELSGDFVVVIWEEKLFPVPIQMAIRTAFTRP